MVLFLYSDTWNDSIIYPSTFPPFGSTISYEKFSRLLINRNNLISSPSQSIRILPTPSVESFLITNGGWWIAVTVNRWPAKPFWNFVGNKLTCGLDSFPLIQDVRTTGTFDPSPSVYNRCVYNTYGFSWNAKLCRHLMRPLCHYRYHNVIDKLWYRRCLVIRQSPTNW